MPTRVTVSVETMAKTKHTDTSQRYHDERTRESKRHKKAEQEDEGKFALGQHCL